MTKQLIERCQQLGYRSRFFVVVKEFADERRRVGRTCSAQQVVNERLNDLPSRDPTSEIVLAASERDFKIRYGLQFSDEFRARVRVTQLHFLIFT